MTATEQSNPFSVQTPEDITADVAFKLWVDVFTDFKKIRDIGHCMLNGPRGSGKSMMFRYLQHDCQCLDRRCRLDNLDFFSVLVSIKNTGLDLTEFQRLENTNASIILNEHFLTMFVASRVFRELSGAKIVDTPENRNAVATLSSAEIMPRLLRCGLPPQPRKPVARSSVAHRLSAISDRFDDLFNQVVTHLKQLAMNPDARGKYAGPLCGYIDFLFPILKAVAALPFMPHGPIYLLIDDADNLSDMQTRVLNSWVATRTSGSVSIKISTQLRYKTYQTTDGTLIESPHDYSEVNLEEIYTSNKGKYLDRVRAIVEKRLASVGLHPDPYKFFPPDHDQEKEIDRIKEQLRRDFDTTGRGHTASDDVVRYARPMFIAGLGGPRKSKSTYCYAGFEQLVDISSGLIRYFLEPAAQMYSEEASSLVQGNVISIEPGTQDRIVRREAEKLMFTEFEKLPLDEMTPSPGSVSAPADQKKRLYNLISALGGLYHLKLVSKDAERRVFSVALSGVPDPDLTSLFRLGVHYGYFQRSSIGNKDGTGRTALYILTRRLAPYFKLDPTSFAGYLFVTSETLLRAVENPDRFLRRVKKEGMDDFQTRQLNLFSEQGEQI